MADIVVEVSGSPPDVTNITQLPHDEIPHAFGFIYRQIMLDECYPERARHSQYVLSAESANC